MSQIPADFERFVQNIITNQQCYIKLTFSSVDELKFCTTYFFGQAVDHHSLSDKFAEAAAKLYFLAPPTTGNEESLNFRKALIAESQLKVEDLQNHLNKGHFPLEKALGVIKFFGELYNVGFIFKGILKKHLDILGAKKRDCYNSNSCYYLLLETVKARVRVVHEGDYTMTIKNMIEAIEDAERNPTKFAAPKNEPKASHSTPKKFEQAFPKLNVDEASSQQMPMKDSIELKKTSFKMLLNKLRSENSAEIIKNIEENHGYVFEDGMWQFCYEELISKALNIHELAGTVVEVCKKLPSCKIDVWRGTKTDDYKKLIIGILCQQIEKLFNETNPSRALFVGNIKFIQKLLEQSLCSIENIANFVDVVISSKEQNPSLASDFLALLFIIVKKKFNAEMVRKLSEEARKKVIQIVKDGKKDVKELEDYLLCPIESKSSSYKIKNEALR